MRKAMLSKQCVDETVAGIWFPPPNLLQLFRPHTACLALLFSWLIVIPLTYCKWIKMLWTMESTLFRRSTIIIIIKSMSWKILRLRSKSVLRCLSWWRSQLMPMPDASAFVASKLVDISILNNVMMKDQVFRLNGKMKNNLIYWVVAPSYLYYFTL